MNAFDIFTTNNNKQNKIKQNNWNSTGFRTFDKPAALLSEEGQRMLEASRPVSTLAALPVQSDWYEHKVKGTDGIVFYRNKGSDRVTYEDPYKSTLAAAADVAADDADGYGTFIIWSLKTHIHRWHTLLYVYIYIYLS
jgi:hypothetical protein